MNVTTHNELASKLWEIANWLRGPYRPPQCRFVMLPIIVLRRFDCVLGASKDKVLAQYQRLLAAQTPETAMVTL